jgi:hypothetical protein
VGYSSFFIAAFFAALPNISETNNKIKGAKDPPGGVHGSTLQQYMISKTRTAPAKQIVTKRKVFNNLLDSFIFLYWFER